MTEKVLEALEAPPATKIIVAAKPRRWTYLSRRVCKDHLWLSLAVVVVVVVVVVFVLANKICPNITPLDRGSRTIAIMPLEAFQTWNGTDVASKKRTNKGVATTPKTVVEKVQMMDKATSPWAIMVKRLDAWPPLRNYSINHTKKFALLEWYYTLQICNSHTDKQRLATNKKSEYRVRTWRILVESFQRPSLALLMVSPSVLRLAVAWFQSTGLHWRSQWEEVSELHQFAAL